MLVSRIILKSCKPTDRGSDNDQHRSLTCALHFQDGGYKYMACPPSPVSGGNMSPVSPLVPTPLNGKSHTRFRLVPTENISVFSHLVDRKFSETYCFNSIIRLSLFRLSLLDGGPPDNLSRTNRRHRTIVWIPLSKVNMVAKYTQTSFVAVM